MRRTGSSVLANPVLVGAVTVLVTLVAVFLAYNANNGLPFVPTTELKVQTTNADQLVRGNEVRSGGYRVGVVSDIVPIKLGDGTTGAELTLKLDQSMGDIPVDSRVTIRPRSALGLKYVELDLGKAKSAYADGETMPVTQTRVPVDLDRVFEMFDEPTRTASQDNLQGFGDAFTGRGVALGRTIDELPRLFDHLQPVMETLSAPETDLEDFFRSLGRTARVVAPVSKTQARLFTTMADTFAAIGKDKEALKAFIAKGPSTLDVSTDSLKVQRPFLRDLADFSVDFKAATHDLRAALPDFNAAIDRGIGVQRRMVDTNTKLQATMTALGDLTQSPGTTGALRGLTGTVATLNPQLRFYGPYQTVCNYWNYMWGYIAEHIQEPDVTGYSERTLINSTGDQTNSLGSMGATAPANGENVTHGNAQFFQGPVYTRAITDDGKADCEQGQRGFIHRLGRYVPAKYRTHNDPRSPGVQGPTFHGRAAVPEGQTFSALPETGPYTNLPASENGER
jgi:virulence factor Mce-like protein